LGARAGSAPRGIDRRAATEIPRPPKAITPGYAEKRGDADGRADRVARLLGRKRPFCLLVRLGFTERIKGSHHIFTHQAVAEILNLQPKKSFVKPYQVKQVRKILVQYKLAQGTL
jgi:hypothetical protein